MRRPAREGPVRRKEAAESSVFCADEMEFIHRYTSPLGGLTLASDGEALIGLWFDGQRYFPEPLGPEATETPLPVFAAADRWLEIYFSGNTPDFTPPLRMAGTPFRRAVWELLLTIPYGETRSYGTLAEQLAERTGSSRVCARAIGGAVGRNPISLIVPCHRVVGAGGALTGYAAGLERKRALLELERSRP